MAPLDFAVPLVLALGLRVVVARRLRGAFSVDHWYWKAYCEGVRAEGRFPPRLPQYLLDERQWYPPIFPRLLVRLPATALDRWDGHLCILLDLLRMSVLMGAAAELTGNGPAVLAAGLVYATSPNLVLYNVQLNPRVVGAFLLDLAALGTLCLPAGSGASWALAAGWVTAALVLLTHKMSTQLLWFMAAAGWVMTGDVRLALTLPISIAAAWVLSAGFYLKVLRAHWDIVAFWSRNWRWLQADPIRESPVYGEPRYRTPGLLHRDGVAGTVQHMVRLARALPAAWVMCGALLILPWPPSPPAPCVAGWAGLAVLFAVLTTFVPMLKCLGAGSLYLFNAAFPVALFFGLTVRGGQGGAWWLAAAGFLANAGALGIHVWRLRGRASSEPGWEALIEHLRAAERGPVLCLPQSLYDELAYKTRQPVLFGGHGYGFRRLEPFFPVLRLSFAEARARHGLRYVVARQGCLSARALTELPGAPRVFGAYSLFEWPGTASSPTAPPL